MTTITGTSGNDVLKGEPGDQLEGLSGDDTYIIYDPATRIVESSNAGNDSVLTFVSYGLTEQANIEYLSTADHSGLDPINLAGNTGAQTIVGNFGNNSLDGRGGDDTLIGGSGDDVFLDAVDRSLAKIDDFGADAVVIALGLDASRDDPFGGLTVSPDGFARIGEKIGTLSCPTVLVQEGGYVSETLAENLYQFISGFGATTKTNTI